MTLIKNILIGMIIGMGVIIPGVSGSVLAIILGVYNDIIYIFSDFKKNIKNNFSFLLSIIIGIIIGTMLFGNILISLLNINRVLICYIFVGLILGSVPILIDEIKYSEKGNFNLKICIITIIFSFFLFLLNKINMHSITEYSGSIKSILILLLGGFLFISGKIIPGVSSSFFMIIIGIYDLTLNIMSNPLSYSIYDYIELIPFFVGCLIGFIILTKFINYLLKNYFSLTYSVIIGFVIGSIFAIIPSFELSLEYLIYIFISLIFLYVMVKTSKKVKKW